MLRLTEPYTKRFGGDNSGLKVNAGYGMAYFDVVADVDVELREFWEENKFPLDKPNHPDHSALTMDFKENKREMVTNLVYRFNLIQAGRELQVEKKEFLEQFSIESVKAIIYATDHCPEEMDIDQYAGLIVHTFTEYGDTLLFEQRIINVNGAESANEMAVVSQQIELFKELLTIPMAETLVGSD